MEIIATTKKAKRVASSKRASSCLLLLVLLLLSCGGYSLHSYKSVGGEWYASDSLLFAVGDSVPTGDLFVGVRYGAEYCYSNLFLQVTTIAGDTVLSCDTVRCNIFDEKGHRNGSTAGALYQAEFFVASIEGARSIIIKHAMSDTLLRGVYDVGVKFAPRGRHQCAGN